MFTPTGTKSSSSNMLNGGVDHPLFVRSLQMYPLSFFWLSLRFFFVSFLLFFTILSFDFITVTVGYLLCTSVPRSTQKHSVFCHCPYWGVVQRFAACECCSFFHQRGSCYFLQGLEGLLFHSPIYILLSLN